MSIPELCYDKEDNEIPIKPSPKEVELRERYVKTIKAITKRMVTMTSADSPVYDRVIIINNVVCRLKTLYSQYDGDYDDTDSHLCLQPTGDIIDVTIDCNNIGKFQQPTEWDILFSKNSSIFKDSESLKKIYKKIIEITPDFNITQTEINEWDDEVKKYDPKFS